MKEIGQLVRLCREKKKMILSTHALCIEWNGGRAIEVCGIRLGTDRNWKITAPSVRQKVEDLGDLHPSDIVDSN